MFSLKEELLHFQVADVGNLEEPTFANVKYFVEKLLFLLKRNNEENERTAWLLFRARN